MIKAVKPRCGTYVFTVVVAMSPLNSPLPCGLHAEILSLGWKKFDVLAFRRNDHTLLSVVSCRYGYVDLIACPFIVCSNTCNATSG